MLKIVSPSAVYFSGKVQRVYLPTESGYVDIGGSHTPLIALLGMGSVGVVVGNKEKESFFISGGVLRVHMGKVVVLGDVVEKSKEIDLKRAQKSEKRAGNLLLQKDIKVDFTRALESQARARARMFSASKLVKYK